MHQHLDEAIGSDGYKLHGQDTLPWEDWTAPWDGASAKLSRAEEHFWSLHDEVWRFLVESPPAMRYDPSPELGDDWYTFSVRYSQPPNRIALIFGDCVANIRAALDHSLTAVHRRAGRRSQFPIFDDEELFREKWADDWEELGGPVSLVNYLHDRQPFSVPPEDDTQVHWLRTLASINNADKHRTLAITNNAIQPDRLAGQFVSAPRPIKEFYWYPVPYGPDEPVGDSVVKIMAVRIPYLPEDAKLDLKSQVFSTVAIETYENVLEMGWYLLASAGKTIQSLHEIYA